MKTATRLLWLFLLVPYVYVVAIWQRLPERLPMHFDLNGVANRYGNKTELIWVLLTMTAVTVGCYFLTAYAYLFDPKKSAYINKDRLKKIALAVSFFTLLTTSFAVLSITRGFMKPGLSIIFSAIGILFGLLGNYMYTIKPNYFVGIRVPWTLENTENWRRTHFFAGRLWFWGGLLLAVVPFFVPSGALVVIFIAIAAILSISPIVYSYLLFRRKKKQHRETSV